MASSGAPLSLTPPASITSTKIRTSMGGGFILHYGDLTDSSSLIRVVQAVRPDEIYNLGAQSHVKVSFEEPEYTANTDALGTLRLLEAIRSAGLERHTRSIRLRRRSSTALCRRSRRKRPLRSIRAHLTPWQSSMHTGSR